jgi:hypothetical protein
LTYTPIPSSVGVTKWNPNDQSGMTLSNNNSTSTSGPAASSVRGSASRTAGLYCIEFSLDAINAGVTVGLANSSYLLTSVAGVGKDANSVGAQPNTTPNQAAFYSSGLLSSLPGVLSDTGERVTEFANLTTKILFYTDTAMRNSVGPSAWNNSSTCNPTVTACGLSFSGMAGPFFPAYSDNQSGGTVTIIPTTPFSVALPSGYNSWDVPQANQTASQLQAVMLQ